MTASPQFAIPEVKIPGVVCRALVIYQTPGVVHGYLNISEQMGPVVNYANWLYKGPGRQEPVDEIRYEADPDCPFRLE